MALRSASVLLASSVLILAACGGDAAGTAADTGTDPAGQDDEQAEPDGGGEPYVIGYLGPLSGGVAFTTAGDLAGLTTYIDSVNADGGVNGRTVEILARDDQFQPELTISEYRNLSRDGVVAVAGMPISTTAEAAQREAESLELTMIGYGIATAPLIEAQSPYVRSTAMLPEQWAESVRSFIEADSQERGLDEVRVAVVGSETAAAETARDAIKEVGEASGLWETVATQLIPQDSTDATTQFRSIANAEPHYIAAWMATAPLHTDALIATGLDDVPVLGPYYTDEASVRAAEVPNYYYPQLFIQPHPDDDENPAMRQVVDAAEAAGQSDGLYQFGYMNGYLMGSILVNALEDCPDPCDSASFAEAMTAAQYDLPEGLAGPDAGFGSDRSQAFSHARWVRMDAEENFRADPVSDWTPFL